MVLDTAVIGAGTSGPSHLSALDRNPKTRLAGVCDLNEDLANKYAEKYTIESFINLDDMLSGLDLDWVHICTPVQTHVEIAKRVIRSDIPVLIQKPISKSVDEVENLQSLADDRNVQVSVVHNRKFTSLMRSVRERINEELGQIRAVNTMYSGIGDPDKTPRGSWVFDLPGGELEEGLSHAIYLTLGIGGYPRGDISASTVKSREYDYDIQYDGVQIEYTSESQSLCHISMISDSATQNKIDIYGNKKVLEVDLASMIALDRYLQNKSPVQLLSQNVSLTSDIIKQTLRNIFNYQSLLIENKLNRHSENSFSSTYYQINKTADSIQRQTAPPVPIQEAKWTVRLTELVHSSLKK